jgi:hypothetical protein
MFGGFSSQVQRIVLVNKPHLSILLHSFGF